MTAVLSPAQITQYHQNLRAIETAAQRHMKITQQEAKIITVELWAMVRYIRAHYPLLAPPYPLHVPHKGISKVLQAP